MSAIHPGNLHGTGSRTNKSRYHYARQRVQDAQKGKVEETDGLKKEDREPKPSSSHNGIMVILVVMIVVTWGVAATAYFGIVDYKGIVARGSKITAVDATEYVTALYPFQYNAIRHPLKSLGNFLSSIDDTITNMLTFTRAPFQIIDKRRQVTGSPVPRLILRNSDLTKRYSGSLQAVPDEAPTPETKRPQEDVGQAKGSKPSEEGRQKQPEPSKPPEEKPKPAKDTQSQDKPDAKVEKPKDVSLTLNLQLFIGQQPALNESHLLSSSESMLKIGSKDKSSQRKDIKIKPNCLLLEKKSLLFTTSPINKANFIIYSKNPPVPRLVLQNVVANKMGYPTIPLDLPQYNSNKHEKTVVQSAPIRPKILPFLSDLSFSILGTKKTFNGNRGNNLNLSGRKLTMNTNPLSRFEVFGNNYNEWSKRGETICTKACFLGLRFLNKNYESKINPKKNLARGGKLASSIFTLNKIRDLKQKLSDQSIFGDKLYRKPTLGSVIPKKFTSDKVNFGAEDAIPYFGQKITLPNPSNKGFDSQRGTENPESSKYSSSNTKIVTPGIVIAKVFGDKQLNEEFNGFYLETQNRPTVPSIPVNKNGLSKNSPRNCEKNFGCRRGDSMKNVVYIGANNKIVKDCRNTAKKSSMLIRGVRNPVASKLSRNLILKIDRKVSDRGFVLSKFQRFVKATVKPEKRLLHSRRPISGFNGGERLISMHKKQKTIQKMKRAVFVEPATPKAKLKRKLSRMFDRTCDVISGIASILQRLNIFEKSFKYLPKPAKLFLSRAKNVTVVSKVLNLVVNTTLNDLYQYTKLTAEKVGQAIYKKCTNFYNFLKKKPSFRNFVENLSKFSNKMQLKFERLSTIIGKHFIKLQHNQKLLTSVLITLSVVGLYHILFAVFNSVLRPKE